MPMLRQFVQLAHDTAEEEPLTLPEVAKMMHTGKSTLSAACTETYGLSVMALMRQVRLEQCRMALLKPDRWHNCGHGDAQIPVQQPCPFCGDIPRCIW